MFFGTTMTIWSVKMEYNLLSMSFERKVVLCGTNVFPKPVLHDDRVLNDHDLFYIFDGEWEIGQDGISYHLAKGDVVFLRAGSHHYGVSPCTPNMRNLFIHINRLPDDRMTKDLSAAEVQSMVKSPLFCFPTVIHCTQNSVVDTLFRYIIHIFWSHRDDASRVLMLNLNLLLTELSFISRNSLPKADTWITMLLQEIQSNSGRFLSLEEAASLVHMSPRSLSTRFKRVMGRTVHEYQLSLKLDMAYNALLSGDYTVKEAAESFGFCDPFYFSRTFKKTYGFSPSELKNGNPSVNVHRKDMD